MSPHSKCMLRKQGGEIQGILEKIAFKISNTSNGRSLFFRLENENKSAYVKVKPAFDPSLL